MYQPGQIGAGERLDVQQLHAEHNERAVLMQVNVYSLTSVDPVQQCFSCEVNLKMWWWESKLAEEGPPLLDERRLPDLSDTHELQKLGILVPTIFYENALGSAL